MPRDGGGFVLSPEEKEELVKKEPLAAKWIRPYIGAVEFLNNKERYCLWLVNADPGALPLLAMTMVLRRRVNKAQPEYAVCFDGGAAEYAYGRLNKRSVSAGGEAQVSYQLTPE